MTDGTIKIKAIVTDEEGGLRLVSKSEVDNITAKKFNYAMAEILHQIYQDFAEESELDEGYIGFLKRQLYHALINV